MPPTNFAPGTQGMIPGVTVARNQPLYDRKNLPTTLSGDIGFFSIPVSSPDTLIRYTTGQAGAAGSISKTKRDTNLPSQGQDPNRGYSLAGVSMALIPAARTIKATAATNAIRAEKDTIREAGWLEWKIVDNKVLEIPLIFIPELNGEGGIMSTASDITTFGGPQFPSKMWPFGEPITINPGQQFTVVVHFDGSITLGQSYDMILAFFGQQKRPVG